MCKDIHCIISKSVQQLLRWKNVLLLNPIKDIVMSKPMQTRKDKEEDKVEQGIEDQCVDVEKNYTNKS